MDILVVSQRCCIRTVKQIIALSKRNNVHLVTKRVPSGGWCESITYYDGSKEQLEKALKLYPFIDIVYVASEPSWSVFSVRKALPKKPLVLDVHDAQVWRSTEPEHRSSEERLAFSWADGLVVPSVSCKKEILKHHETRGKVLVLPPYVNKELYYTRSWGWCGGIVYQGRVDLPDAPKFMDYCKYEELSRQLDDEGIAFNIYMPGDDKALEKWRKIYSPICNFKKGLQYEQMLSALGFYDWGLCGNLGKHREWDLSMPNKLFDYLAGGIPVIALNAKETGDFVEKHGLGISVSSIQEIKDKWDSQQIYQRNVILKRDEFCMERHIHRLEDFLGGFARF